MKYVWCGSTDNKIIATGREQNDFKIIVQYWIVFAMKFRNLIMKHGIQLKAVFTSDMLSVHCYFN